MYAQLVRGLLPPPECRCLADQEKGDTGQPSGNTSSRYNSSASTSPTAAPTVMVGKQRGWQSLQGAKEAEKKREVGLRCKSWGGDKPW
jgi:hypothetical protein